MCVMLRLFLFQDKLKGEGSKDERGLNVDSVRGHFSKLQNRNQLDQ